VCKGSGLPDVWGRKFWKSRSLMNGYTGSRELPTFVSSTSLYASPVVSSLPPSRGIAKPWNRHSAREREHGIAFSHAFACELMRGVLLSLMPRGRSTICKDLVLLGTRFRGICWYAPKVLGILSSRKRSAWKSGSRCSARRCWGSSLTQPRGARGPAGNPQMPFVSRHSSPWQPT
jgi:hypothetical protein